MTSATILTTAHRTPWDIASDMEEDVRTVRNYARLLYEMFVTNDFSTERVNEALCLIVGEILDTGHRLNKQNEEAYELARNLRAAS